MARFCEFENGCDNLVFGTDRNTRKGFCKSHQWCRTDISKLSISQRAIEKHKAEKSNKSFDNKVKEIVSREEEREIVVGKGFGELWRWFERQREFMTGICMHCGGKTEKFNDEKFHYSICHILPKGKNYFPSVATNDSNWIELCYYNNSCHSNLDNHMIDLIELNCWSTVIDRFIAMYPSIDNKEKRRIPTVLLQYVNTEI